MMVVAALMIGVLFTGATYLLLRRSMIKLLLGFVLLSHAISLLLFLVGGVGPAGAPDPLARALVMVAMIGGLSFITVLLVLVYRANWEVGSDDLDDITSTDTL